MIDEMREELDRAYEKVIYYLGNRDYFELELRLKLYKKDFSEEAVNYAINKVKSEGYLDDYRYGLVYSKRYLLKEGGLKVISRLIEKGLSPEVAGDLIEDAEIDEREVAKAVLSKKMNETLTSDLSDPKKWQKMARYLKNRGFRDNIIIEVLNNLR